MSARRPERVRDPAARRREMTWPARIGFCSCSPPSRARCGVGHELEHARRLRARRRSPRRLSADAAAHPPRPRARRTQLSPVSSAPAARASGLHRPSDVALDLVDVDDARRAARRPPAAPAPRPRPRAPTDARPGRPRPRSAEPRDARPRQVRRLSVWTRCRTRARRALRRRPAACAPLARDERCSRLRRTSKRARPGAGRCPSREDVEDLLLRRLRCNGVDHLPGSIAIRRSPTVLVPAPVPRSVHLPAIWPRSAGRPRPRPSGRSHARSCHAQRRAQALDDLLAAARRSRLPRALARHSLRLARAAPAAPRAAPPGARRSRSSASIRSSRARTRASSMARR